MEGILKIIPVGHDNALNVSELSRRLNKNERDVRRMISVARREAVILNMQDGQGYFIPAEDEKDLTERWLNQEESRLKDHALSLRAARKAKKERSDDRQHSDV